MTLGFDTEWKIWSPIMSPVNMPGGKMLPATEPVKKVSLNTGDLETEEPPKKKSWWPWVIAAAATYAMTQG